MRGYRLMALAFLGCAGFAGAAGAETFSAHYRVVLSGFEVGTGELAVEIDGANYRVALDAAIADGGDRPGLRANLEASGHLAFGRVRPDLYRANLVKLQTTRRIGITFADGNVGALAVLPPIAGGSGGTRPALLQSRNVMDPLTALAVPAAEFGLAPLSVCGRTQRVFDGITRYDVEMFPSRVETIVLTGVALTTVVCRAQLRTVLVTPRIRTWPYAETGPINALIWLAPIGDGRLLVPARIETSTRWGKVVIETITPRAFSMTSPAAWRDQESGP